MVKLGVPNIVITIPRIAALIAIAGVVASNVQTHTQAPSPTSVQPQPTATHQIVLSTPAPTTSLPGSPSTTTAASAPATATPLPVTDIPRSAQTEPVITPTANANVNGLTPANKDTSPTGASGDSTSSQGASGVQTTDSYISTNWAGYIAGAGNYTSVSGSWNVPVATNSSTSTAADATWIGIGGVKGNDLIQVGTFDTATARGESSSAFYELLPDNARMTTHLIIKPGDSVKASLTEVTTGVWKIAIADTTTGQSFTTTKSYTSSGSTAEWIEEDPSTSVRGQSMPLDAFTPISFTNGSVVATNADNTYTSLTIKTSGAQPITLVSMSGQTMTPIITPSVLGSDGQSFTLKQK